LTSIRPVDRLRRVSDGLKHTPLEAAHVELGAKLVPFAGWFMPVQYTSILDEHGAVRNKAGIFDISHMGQFVVGGPAAAEWLNSLLTNDIAELAVNQGQYTLMLNEAGGVIDDLIVYRTGLHEFFLVVNASKIDEDFEWMDAHKSAGVTLLNYSNMFAGLAIQGPEAAAIFHSVFPGESLPLRNGVSNIAGCLVCRTGYTGEDGFEFFCHPDNAAYYWERFLAGGAKPCGLGARDSLRLEMGYPLNGSDLSPERTPLEAGLGFFVDLEKGDFIGRDVLAKQKAEGVTTKLVGLRYTDKGAPPRAHYGVYSPEGETLGELSSGVLSPSLGQGIGMAYLPVAWTKLGTELTVDVRGRRFPAKVVKKPFYKPVPKS
jgi:aminomethyltransferase